jgi:hypothetical protein
MFQHEVWAQIMEDKNGNTDDVAPEAEKRWFWLKLQGRDLSTKLDDLQAEFRAIADRLRGAGRDGCDDHNLGQT